ncbi:ATP-grasp domain-containing protein [Enteractinococcus fodinae]|uniref:Carbamoyl-phosphate synthase large subunit n=1 Tax=Enteractinococcus fodinae TaxID=684663 RepID=A0ABU2AZT9_9MICC|nr:ATP-grasp domain-containing protein [Enteractinococcus fodinae]MDR7346068.1 carbamoyl-phosphate synthase large subunit [Enteractinococcus fodinae]
MANNQHLKIVIASAGRRAHYIQWFKDALRTQEIPGEVIALDYRATSPTVGLADRAYQTPAYNSPEYLTMIRDWFTKERPDLFLCMNDYEAHALSQGVADELRELGCAVAVLNKAAHEIVLDKHYTAEKLNEYGIPTPSTYLGSDVALALENSSADSKFVVKHRYGAGSTGVHIVTADELAEAVDESAQSALGPDGKPAHHIESVIIQDFLPGAEYGVDGVFSVDGRSEFLGLVARRKEQMRGGDTDLATSVDPAPFRASIIKLGQLLCPTGSIDVDFRDNAVGEPMVIDVNPRMGGGYPFSHRAGADMPSALVRAAAGLAHLPELLDYEHNVTTARREEFTVISKG